MNSLSIGRTRCLPPIPCSGGRWKPLEEGRIDRTLRVRLAGLGPGIDRLQAHPPVQIIDLGLFLFLEFLAFVVGLGGIFLQGPLQLLIMEEWTPNRADSS
jgi:hypothetical protein